MPQICHDFLATKEIAGKRRRADFSPPEPSHNRRIGSPRRTEVHPTVFFNRLLAALRDNVACCLITRHNARFLDNPRTQQLECGLVTVHGAGRGRRTFSPIDFTSEENVAAKTSSVPLCCQPVNAYCGQTSGCGTREGKGDWLLLCEAPVGPFRQKVPVPFSLKLWRIAVAERAG
jgi:hypothetical protein